MEFKASQVLEIRAGLGLFAQTRDVDASTQLKIARILLKIEQDAALIDKQIANLQKKHEGKPVEGKPGLVQITKDFEAYRKSMEDLEATVIKLDIVDVIPMSALEGVKLTTNEMRALMPFISEEK